MSKQITKVIISWNLNHRGYSKSGEVALEYRKYPLDEELYENLIKRFRSGELTGFKISPTPKELKVKYKRRFFENGVEVKPVFPEYEHIQ